MNSYEGLFLIRADLEKQKQNDIVGSIEKEITEKGGKLKEAQDLSKRPLAYPINSQKEALYHLVNFDAPSDIINSLRDSFKLNNSILRTLIIKRG